jgi:hypothetical protein
MGGVRILTAKSAKSAKSGRKRIRISRLLRIAGRKKAPERGADASSLIRGGRSVAGASMKKGARM